jgi:hypothetical protein
MSRYFPKTISPRQGKRMKDRWGPCKECGDPTAYRCRKCEAWRCITCIRFRAAPGMPGVYFAGCYPKCRKRMHPVVAQRVRKVTRFLMKAPR